MTGQSAKSDTSPFLQHYTSALEHLEQGRPEKAAQRFKQAAIADPEKWCDVARELARAGHAEEALAALHQVIQLHPDRSDVLAASWNEVGNIVYDMGDTEQANKHFEQSWAAYKTYGSSANMALAALRQGRLTDAQEWIEIALFMNPWCPESQMVQADINFNLGKYRTAFRQYECRWRSRRQGLAKVPSPKPEWPGPPHKGRLLVVGEQGIGDVILMLRYARLIRKRGLTQTWVVHDGLKPLAQSMGVIDHVLIAGEHFNDYDFQIASGSLPRVFNTSLETIPTAAYIPKPILPWRYTNFNVGLCWRGSSKNPNDNIRSTNLSDWAPVLAVPNVEFHSLQFGDGEADLETFPQIKRHPRPESWLETAQIVSGLDLVISVDTAMVHLCGAMGVPCWVPLHCRPYFVYPMCREDTPWYPSVRLFKQKKEHQWKEVFENIANELKEKK